MVINFPSFNLFKSQEQKLEVCGFNLNVQRYNRFTGLLKTLGIVEEIHQGKSAIHLDRASIITQYREQLKPQGLSDEEIINIVRTCLTKKPIQIPDQVNISDHLSTDLQITETPAVKAPIFIVTETPTVKGPIIAGPLAGIAIQTGTIKSPEKTEAHLKAEKIIDDIAVFMKSNLLPEQELEAAIKNQYQMLKLMNSDGTWIDSARLKTISSELLQPGQSRESCEQLIDEMTSAMKSNPYFLNCLANIPEEALKNFKDRLSTENGKKLMEYLIPYAFALNSLTAAFAKDVDLFVEVDKLWSKEKPFNSGKSLSFFGWIKYKTLGKLSRAKKPLLTHKVDKQENRYYLNLNIFEAVVADKYFIGNKENAKAGEALMRHRVGGENDVRTGAGPTTIGVRKKGDETYEIIKGRPDLPKEWADLYTTWNLAFISNGDDFPLLAMKLFIPSVNNYADDPQSYMHHRVIALYLHFQFSIFRDMAGQQHDYLRDDWSSKEITAALGHANLKSSKEYEKSVENAKKSFLST